MFYFSGYASRLKEGRITAITIIHPLEGRAGWQGFSQPCSHNSKLCRCGTRVLLTTLSTVQRQNIMRQSNWDRRRSYDLLFSSRSYIPSYSLDFAVLPRRVSPFGHRRIKGCSPPPRRLSQARHVLHRRSKPRHPPYALNFYKEKLEIGNWRLEKSNF